MRFEIKLAGKIPTCALLAVFLMGCHTLRPDTRSPAQLLTARAHHPAHWWTPIPTNVAPAWEILPQAAAPGEVILSKRNQLGLLPISPPRLLRSTGNATPASKVSGI